MNTDYMEFRWQIQRDMEKAKHVITSVHEEFATTFGRTYHQVEGYCVDDADVVMVISGTVASTGRDAIDSLREREKRWAW